MSQPDTFETELERARLRDEFTSLGITGGFLLVSGVLLWLIYGAEIPWFLLLAFSLDALLFVMAVRLALSVFRSRRI